MPTLLRILQNSSFPWHSSWGSSIALSGVSAVWGPFKCSNTPAGRALLSYRSGCGCTLELGPWIELLIGIFRSIIPLVLRSRNGWNWWWVEGCASVWSDHHDDKLVWQQVQPRKQQQTKPTIEHMSRIRSLREWKECCTRTLNITDIPVSLFLHVAKTWNRKLTPPKPWRQLNLMSTSSQYNLLSLN